MNNKKYRIPQEQRRVLVCGRISPNSMKYLKSFGAQNYGRAIDQLVLAHQSIVKAIKPEKREEFNLPSPLRLD